MKKNWISSILLLVCTLVIIMSLIAILQNAKMEFHTQAAPSETQYAYFPYITKAPDPPLAGAAIGYTGAQDMTAVTTRLFFPSFRKDNLGWNSAIAVQNISNTNATLNINFFNQDGTVIHTETNISLLPFGTYLLMAQNLVSLPGGVYTAVAESSENIVGMASTLDSSGTMATGYNSVGQGAQEFIIPIFVKEYYGISSRICLQNTTAILATVEIEYDNVNNSTYTHWFEIDANGFKCFETGNFPFLPSGYSGTALISSNETLVVAVEDISDTGALARGYLGIDLSTGANQNFVPQCRRQNGWQTFISFLNIGQVSSAVYLDFYRDNGDIHSSYFAAENQYPTGSILCHENPPWISPPFPIEDYNGSAVVSSNIETITLVSDQHLPGDFDLLSYPGLPISTTTAFLPNVGYGKDAWKGVVSIQNVTQVTNTVQVSFYSLLGSLEMDKAYELPPHGMVQVEIDQILDLKNTFNGSAIISSSYPMAVAVIKVR